MYKHHPPYCVAVCMTTGCNLQCSFCGIKSIQEKPNQNNHYMTLETAEKIAKGIHDAGWNSRIEFGIQGETTMNPDWIEIISIFREHNPKNQILVLTNGAGLMKGDSTEILLQYFDAGGTKIAIEDYASYKIFDKVFAKISVVDMELEGINVYHYPKDRRGNPHTKDNKRALIFIGDLEENTKGTHSNIINMAGNASPLDMSKQDQRCAHVFRKLPILSTGEVPICCHDWAREFTIGSVHDNTPEELWHHERYVAARNFLYHGLRTELRPCYGCNARTYRNGLLPDAMGKESLPMPSSQAVELVDNVLSTGPTKQVTNAAMENIVAHLPERFARNWDFADNISITLNWEK